MFYVVDKSYSAVGKTLFYVYDYGNVVDDIMVSRKRNMYKNVYVCQVFRIYNIAFVIAMDAC
jgi:hypothetical protein